MYSTYSSNIVHFGLSLETGEGDIESEIVEQTTGQ